jgi:hypothetical protein
MDRVGLMARRIVTHFRGTNAQLLVYVMPLWWRTGDLVLDPTHGLGNWCKVFPPEHLICHDLKIDGVDFRYPVEEPGVIDLILFDPDYVSVGGHDTSTMPEHHDRYGMTSDGWKACFADIALGIKAQAQLLKSTGRLLVKSGIYTESGQKHNGLANVYNAGAEADLEFLGQICHHTGPSRQPPRRRQLTIHEAGSHLVCLGGPKARRHLEKTTRLPKEDSFD